MGSLLSVWLSGVKTKELLWRPQALEFGSSASSTKAFNCAVSTCQLKYGKLVEQDGEENHKVLSSCFFLFLSSASYSNHLYIFFCFCGGGKNINHSFPFLVSGKHWKTLVPLLKDGEKRREETHKLPEEGKLKPVLEPYFEPEGSEVLKESIPKSV